MIITESQLNEFTRSHPINEARCFSAVTSKTSVFLSHKHTDKTLMLQIKTMLENIGISAYIDWLDQTMSGTTSGDTAIQLKAKIKDSNKFILVATNDAIDSKWCNWELGLGDMEKYDSNDIAIFPIQQYDRIWSGNEYLQIYPTIEYEDGSGHYSTGEIIIEGYYVCYPRDVNGRRIIWKLKDWLVK
jgi:hypothetical protein